MDEENKGIINDALLSGTQSPHNPLLATEAVECDDSFEIFPSPRDCLELAWGTPREGLTLSPPYSHPTWDLGQCDDWLDVLSSPSDYEDKEITESPSSPSQPAWDLLQAGPSVHQTGLSYTQADPSHIQAGLHHRKNTIKSQSMVFECEHCKKAFSTRFNLWRHIRTAHEQNPKYLVCEHCGKRFLRTDNLQKHIKSIHSIRKPDRTKHLPERFHCPSPREQLLQGNTEESGSTLDGDIKYGTKIPKCDNCQKVFTKNSSLRRHIHAVHEGDPASIVCNYCRKRFLRRDNLRAHIKNKHSSEKPEHLCSNCGSKFTTSASRNRHEKIFCPVVRGQSLIGYRADESANVDVDADTYEAGAHVGPDVVEPGPSTVPAEHPLPLVDGPDVVEPGPSTVPAEHPLPLVDGQSLIGYRADEFANVDVDADTYEAGAHVGPDVVEPGPSTVPAEHPLPLVDGCVPHACARCGRQYSARSSLLRHLKYECGLPPRFCCQQCSFKTHRKRTLELHMFIRHGSISFQ